MRKEKEEGEDEEQKTAATRPEIEESSELEEQKE